MKLFLYIFTLFWLFFHADWSWKDMEDVNSTMNFTTNSTTHSIGLLSSVALCVCSINVLLGFPLHFYVIWLIVTETGIVTDFFNLNLSVCEIANCLKCLIDLMSFCFSISYTLSHFLQGLGVTGRPLFQSLICVERFLAVVHPVIFLKFRPFRYKVICCTAGWISTLGSCLFCMFIPFNSSPYTRLFTVQFLLFTFVQLFCLVAVLRTLKQSGPGEQQKEKEKENQMKRRVFIHILITTLALVFISVPYKISAFILTHSNGLALWFITSVGYLLNGFLQPVLFLRRTGKSTCSS